MNEQQITDLARDVIRELDLAEARLSIDASNPDLLRLSMTEGDGDTKNIEVTITSEGVPLEESELRQRIRQHLVTFAAINVAS